jgi:competence protein ComEC
VYAKNNKLLSRFFMQNFIAKAVFFRLSIAFVIGILCFEIFNVPFVFVPFASLLGIVLIVFCFTRKTAAASYKYDFLFGSGFLLLIVCIGFLRTSQNAEERKFSHSGDMGIYQISLTDFPSEKTNSMLVYAHIRSFSDSVKTEKCAGKITLFFEKDSAVMKLKIGDKLLISTILSLPENKNNPDEFDYRKYLTRKNIVASGYVSSGNWCKTGEEKSFSLFRGAQKVRMQMLDIYRNMGISGDEFGTVAALTLGYKDALSPELRESFSATGASHVLAVSGLHVGIIFLIISELLKFMDKNKTAKRCKSLIIICFLWFYAFLTGLCPSVCRAALMFSIMAFGNVIDRKSYTYNTIFVSFFILLLINPNLIFDVGFQLSYAAVLSIIYFQPKINKFFYFKSKPMIWLWSLTSVSLAAQLGTMPISMFYFHQFPYYFWISNIVVIPAASFIVYSATSLFITSKIHIINDLNAFVLKWIVKIMHYCIEFIENLPNALSITWFNGIQVILLYSFIITAAFLFYKTKFKTFVCTEISLMLLFLTILIHNIDNQNFRQLTIFNHKDFTLNIVENKKNFVYASDIETAEKLASTFWIHHGCKNPVFQELDTIEFAKTIQFSQKTFLILTNKKIFGKVPENPLYIDYLVINKNIFPAQDIFDKYFRPKTLITTGDVYDKSNRTFAVLAKANGINFYSIKQNGAFILR